MNSMTLVYFSAAAGVMILLKVLKAWFSCWQVRRNFTRLGVYTPSVTWLVMHYVDSFRLGKWKSQTQLYSKYKQHKAYGSYDFKLPTIVLNDKELIRAVMVKQFNSFTDRFVILTFDVPFQDSLLTLRGKNWQRVRNLLSPTFRPSRLKKLSKLLQGKMDSLLQFFSSKVDEEIELKETMSRYMIDTIASTVFGLESNSLNNPDEAFAVCVRGMLNFNIPLYFIILLFPWLREPLRKRGYTIIPKKALDYFQRCVYETMVKREESDDAGNLNDYTDLLMNGEEEDTNENWSGLDSCSYGDILPGATLNFVIAGYETVSTVMSFTLFLLAMHPDCQRRVQEEVDKMLPCGTQDLNYEVANNLTYLNQCINETIRMYPPGLELQRMCTDDITIQGVTFERGTVVRVPVYALHMNSDIWDEPQEFRPERFDLDTSNSRHQFSFIPFGYGPRHCIGMRLAQLELKMTLGAVLHMFNVVPCSKTVFPVKLDKHDWRTKALDDIYVKLERR